MLVEPRYTCPIIDSGKRIIAELRKELMEALEELKETRVDRIIDEIENIADNFHEKFNDLEEAFEDVRESNIDIREWGREQSSLAESREGEIDDLTEQLTVVTKELEEAKDDSNADTNQEDAPRAA